ncbi:MAG: class I SAM-dependent methyltransferase, partial [Terracidiphilus sp.]
LETLITSANPHVQLCFLQPVTCYPMDDLLHIHEPPQLPALLEQAACLDFTMASEPKTGALLRVLAASKPAGRILELGTGVGVGAAWLLSGMDASSTLISVDTNFSFQSAARRILGIDPRLSLVLEDAVDFLVRQPSASFDLVFADALRGKFEGLDEALTVVKPGGFYVIDDLLPQPNWPEGHGDKIAPLVERLASLKDFHIVPITWASGLVLAVKKI